MQVAITGGSGFLGQYVINLLNSTKQYRTISIGRTLIRESKFASEHRVTDYTVQSLEDILSDIDIVVHLAAKRGGEGHINEFQDNVTITQNLYEACRLRGIKNIVFASSISVYSGENVLPWDEREIPKPRNSYGISKLTSELIGDLYNREYDMKIKNLRFAHLFGCNEPNDYMINKFMRQAFNKEELVLYSKDNVKREFLYNKDAAYAVLCGIKNEELCGSFNIGSGEMKTNYEIAEIINKTFDNVGNLKVLDRKDTSKHSSFMSSERAMRMLDYSPRYSIEAAFTDIYKEMKSSIEIE